VLREALFQTKQCYLPKIKHFGSPNFFWSLPNFWSGYTTGYGLFGKFLKLFDIFWREIWHFWFIRTWQPCIVHVLGLSA